MPHIRSTQLRAFLDHANDILREEPPLWFLSFDVDGDPFVLNCVATPQLELLLAMEADGHCSDGWAA